MSLDVYLELDEPVDVLPIPAIYVRQEGQNKRITRAEWDRRFPDQELVTVTSPSQTTELYTGNITHNLAKMAAAAGIYEHLWRPDEIGFARAEELISPLTEGLARLRERPDHYRQYNPANGWGMYETLVSFIADYLWACKRWPKAKVTVSR